MRVRDCMPCRFCKRYTWVDQYQPSGYHNIGMTHAYHKCEKHKKRCIDVKKCNDFDDLSGKRRASDVWT